MRLTPVHRSNEQKRTRMLDFDTRAFIGIFGRVPRMRHRPQALLVMRPDSHRIQFGPDQLRRLGELAELGDPVWAGELDTPAVRARLAEVEVLLTSWGCPELTAERLDAAPRLRAILHCAGSVRPIVTDAV